MKGFPFQTVRKCAFAAGLALLSSAPVHADTGDVVFSETFDSQEAFNKWTTVDINGGRTWEYFSGKAAYMLDYQTYLPGDDYLVSPEFDLDASKVYCLTFSFNVVNSTESMRVLLGEGDDPTKYTTVLLDFPKVKKDASGDKTAKLYVAASGKYRLAFYSYSPAHGNRMEVDDVVITEKSLKGVPSAVTDLTLRRGDKGALASSLSFSAPTLTADSASLDGTLDIDIYRNGGDAPVYTYSAVSPGSHMGWPDEAPVQGFNTYRVVTRNAKGTGEDAEITDFIGVDTVKAVTALTARLTAQRGVSLSWTAPSETVHGGYADFLSLRYVVMRDGVQLGDPVADTSFEDANPVDEGQRAVTYTVAPQIGEVTGEAVQSGSVVTGEPLKMPYAESFAHQQMTTPWSLDPDVRDFEWTLMPDDEEGEYEEIVSQDNDGGILRAESKYAGQGEQSRFVSPLLDLSSLKSPVLTFWFYYARSAWYDPDYDGEINDNITVQLSNDAGEWQTVEGSTFRLNDNSNGWTRCEVYLPKSEASFTRVGLLATADADASAYRNMYIDNLSIDESSYDNDLAMASFTTDKLRLSIDETATFEATVFNRGTSSTSDYTVDIIRDGEVVKTYEGVAVAPAGRQTFTYTYKGTLDEAQQDHHDWAARVTLATDEFADNDLSDSLSVSVRRPDVPAVSGLTGQRSGTTVGLSWTAAQSVAPVAHGDMVSVTDDFEDYEPFLIEGIGDWTLYDGDKATTLVSPRIPLSYDHQGEAMAFQVFNVEKSGTYVEGNMDDVFAPHSGTQYLLCPSADYPAENDDWLISPRLDGRAQTVTFWAHSATYDLEWISLWASSTDNHHDSFTKVSEGDHLSVGERWQQITFDVPEGTRYFAIRCVRRSVFLFLDDITYARYDGATDGLTLVGYNVYRDGERVNAEPVTSPSYTDAVGDTADHTYRVTAVYAEGESDYSEPVTVGTATGISGAETSGSDAVSARYNLAGQHVSSSAHGVTIVRTADGLVRKTVTR